MWLRQQGGTKPIVPLKDMLELPEIQHNPFKERSVHLTVSVYHSLVDGGLCDNGGACTGRNDALM